MDRLTVPEAAEVLGVTRDAVYKRVQRGQIPWDKDEEGRLYVYVDPSVSVEDESTDNTQESTDTHKDTERDALLEGLRNQNELLRNELVAWQEEARRKDAILMTMAQRIPELEPASPETPPEAAQSNGTSDEGVNLRPDTHESQNGAEQRSWWQRLFGG